MLESVETLVTQFERGELARREFVAGGPNGEIDHFAVGIDDFREGATASALKARGLEIKDAGESVFVKDPNGTWVQLSAPRYRG